MEVVLPSNLKGRDLFDYLVKNKSQLKMQKKAGFKKGMGVGFDLEKGKGISLQKSKVIKVMDEDNDDKSLIVENISNLANWFDYDQDVILNGAYNKTVADRKNNRPSLKNHIYSTDAIIGNTLDVYVGKFNTADLGLKTDVATTEGLVFKTQVIKGYDESTYYKYKHGAIKEHSSGLYYRDLQLAVNDPEFEDEYKIWQAFYKDILNKEDVDQYGYFWGVRAIDVFENSAVVFGANPMTPTIAIEEKEINPAVVDTEVDKKEGAVVDTHKENDFMNYLNNL